MVENKVNTNPVVSVIVPCYNHEKYIEECIMSIVNQTYKNIELIVIDDGSKDNSPAILERLQKQYGFFLEIQSNMGIAKTLNKAIRNYAHGKYIDGCGSDDFLAPDKIEKQVAYMESHPDCSMVFGKVHMVDEKSRIIEEPVIFKPFPEEEKDITFEILADNNCIPALTMMHTREIWDKCGGYNENMRIEDYDLWLKIAYYGKIVYLNDYFAYYRWHGENASTYVKNVYVETRELIQSWKDRMTPEVARKILPRRDSYTFSVLARKYKKESLKYFKPFHTYWDSYIIGNYLKGFWKLAFSWNNNTGIWK